MTHNTRRSIFISIKTIFVFGLLGTLSFSTIPNSYEGNDILNILGANKDSPLFKDFRNFWLLDKKNENTSRGVKLNVNENTGVVESIILLGADTSMFGRRFSKCPVQLPFGISFNDDSISLRLKLAKAETWGDSNFKFGNNNIAVEAAYSELEKDKIVLLKFSIIPKPGPAESCDSNGSISKGDDKIDEHHRLTEKKEYRKTEGSEFKKSILAVFDAWQQSAFNSIKTTPRTDRNFWNYRFTYNTRLKIPGEKYNMLYSFPFLSSQLDFVAVLKESEVYDKAFERTYENFQKELLTNFPASDGWVSSCIEGEPNEKLADIEVRNDKYGAVILDYCKNPKGRHVLYLRFLLFSS